LENTTKEASLSIGEKSFLLAWKEMHSLLLAAETLTSTLKRAA
jgi:hypothetical protein